MKRTPKRIGRFGTIKARVLTIALIPSLAILLVGAGLSGYLINKGIQDRKFAGDVSSALAPTSRFVVAVQEERMLTLLWANNPAQGRAELDKQRHVVDAALADASVTGQCMTGHSPGDPQSPAEAFRSTSKELPAKRQRADVGEAKPAEVYEFYNELVDLCGMGIQGIARSGSDAQVSFEQMISYDLFKSAEAMSRSHAMAVRGVFNGLDGEQFHELAHQLGMYHEQVQSVVPRMTKAEQDQYAALKKTPQWKELVTDDNMLMTRGPTPAGTTPPFDVRAWEDSARTVANGLIRLYISHSNYAAQLGDASGTRAMLVSVAGGGVILLLAITVFLIALRLSTLVIRRLTRLRQETLDLADRQLPGIVQRLRDGETVEVETEVPWLDHGGDEIGQVASAFNKAQRTAVTAAIEEAETRQGVREVFLNIAHRNQVVVHRQLETLYQAERSEDDPDQLQLLFQLDHLATRSRRNAENLIIMGGGKPGRQWRNPVPLVKIVGSAVAETEHYTRVEAVRLPNTPIIGAAVADLVHLLAELIDNATLFSPPQTQVEVRGNVVGKGIAIRVEDQGIGIEPDQLAALNAMLQQPPDFSVRALSTDSRVGLFVVARLAARQGIRITLQESAYGGTVAVVLIPSSLVAADVASEPNSGSTDASRTSGTPSRGAANTVPWPDDLPTGVMSIVDKVPTAEVPVVREETAPEQEAPATREKPPLPQRHRQQNLAPQLLDDTTQAAEPQDPAEGDSVRTPERSRTTMTAFQQGTRRARVTSLTGAHGNGETP